MLTLNEIKNLAVLCFSYTIFVSNPELMRRTELINQLIKDTQLMKSEVKEMMQLDEEILNFKPSENSWSALESIEHLNIADAHYLAQFGLKVPENGTHEKDDFKSGWIGGYFVRAMKPKSDGTIPSPMKTFSKFMPSAVVQLDTLAKFVDDQDLILTYLKRSSSLNLNRIKIPSAIGAIVTFKLGDAFSFLIAHNQRHIIQAKSAIQAFQG